MRKSVVFDQANPRKQANYEMALIQNAGLLKENEYLRRLLTQVGEGTSDPEVSAYIEGARQREFSGYFRHHTKNKSQDIGEAARAAWQNFLKAHPQYSYLQNLKPHQGKTGPLRFLLIAGGGGLGDVLMYTPLLAALKRTFWPCEVSLFYSPAVAQDVCASLQMVDAVFTGDWGAHMAGFWALEELDIYDVVIYSPCFFPRYILGQKARLTSPEAVRWITGNNCIADMLARFSTNFGTNLLDRFFQTHYLNILGRLTGLDIHEESPLLFSPEPSSRNTIRGLNLPDKYVTVRDGANPFDMAEAHRQKKERTNKQIAAEKWQQIVADLRTSGYFVVQVGSGEDPLIPNVDLNLCSRTSLSELCFLMKGAVTHIDTEGGLVHFARAVHVPSVALFGSTSASFFGYPQNINLSAPTCSPCFYAHRTWIATCPRQTQGPVCATDINPLSLLDQVKTLDQQKHNECFEIVAYSPVTEQTSLESNCLELAQTLISTTNPPRVVWVGKVKDTDLLEQAMEKAHNVHIVVTGDAPDNRQNNADEALGPWLERLPTYTADYGSIWNLPCNSAHYDLCLCVELKRTTLLAPESLRELLRLVRIGGHLVLGLSARIDGFDLGSLLSPQDLVTRLSTPSAPETNDAHVLMLQRRA